MKTYEVEIVDVKWITDLKGFVNAHLVFNKIEAVKKEEIPPFLICGAQYYEQEILGVGCKLVLEVVNGTPKILEKTQAIKFSTIPTVCPACKGNLYKKGERLHCFQYGCPAKERTPLYRLFKRANVDCSYALLEEWLDQLPFLGHKIPINGLWDFLIIFQQFMPIGQARKIELDKQFDRPQAGILLEMEKTVEKKLKEGITFEDFWYIQFSDFDFDCDDYEKLKDIDPLSSTLQKIELTGLPKEKIQILADCQNEWIGIALFWKERFPIIPSQRKES